MPQSRQSLINLEATPYYHCISHCVRRAFLCGTDDRTGESYEHRRKWVEERLLELSHSFAVKVCAYAVMSNHTHVVLFVDQETANSWDLKAIVEHWHGVFAGISLSQRYLRGETLCEAEEIKLREIAETWRERLMSISWFMRCLNETIARMANEEDGCTGRFWEGRFKSQALLDEAALAACLAYVDLNPIRAGMAETPEQSDHTSIQQRIRTLEKAAQDPQSISFQPPELLPFVGNPRKDMPKGLPFVFKDYLELVDWTGRILRDDKRGAIPDTLPPVLKRLQIEPQAWITLNREFESRFRYLAGNPTAAAEACAQLGRQWAWDTTHCRELFSP